MRDTATASVFLFVKFIKKLVLSSSASKFCALQKACTAWLQTVRRAPPAQCSQPSSWRQAQGVQDGLSKPALVRVGAGTAWHEAALVQLLTQRCLRTTAGFKHVPLQAYHRHARQPRAAAGPANAYQQGGPYYSSQQQQQQQQGPSKPRQQQAAYAEEDGWDASASAPPQVGGPGSHVGWLDSCVLRSTSEATQNALSLWSWSSFFSFLPHATSTHVSAAGQQPLWQCVRLLYSVGGGRHHQLGRCHHGCIPTKPDRASGSPTPCC